MGAARAVTTRLSLLEQDLPGLERTVADLRAQIAIIPTDSFSVKRVYPEIEPAWQDEFWRFLTQEKVDFMMDLEPGRSLFDLGGLLADLQQLLGCPVDVVTEAGLRQRIRTRVWAEARPL